MGRQTRFDREIKSSKHSASTSKKKTKTKKNGFKRFLIFILRLGIICCYAGLFLLYGPYSGFRDWYITTAKGTMSHQYLADLFYDDATIQECLSRNKIIQVVGTTDASKIVFTVDDNKGPFENEYEEAVLKRSDKNNDYKIIKITEKKFTAYLTVIYDPSRIRAVATSKIGEAGEYLSEISRKNNSLIAINAGGFIDENFEGDGGTPIGITISFGKLITDTPYDTSKGGGLIGFNKDNVLVLDSMMKKDGIRDAVSCEPFLILNGKAATIVGNGGRGRAPLTGIGQRADGKVLFLTIDGDRTLGRGATLNEEIEIFQRYGAINAANLDGGTSTSLTVGNTLVNNPSSLNTGHRSRRVATAFILTKDSSNDGDHTVVANKLN